MSNQHLVKGTIDIEKGKPFHNATIYIRLEDTSKADAASKVISQQVLNNMNFDSFPTAIPFSLSIESPDERTRYTVSVHIDINKSGNIDRGDYINMESYPVLTYGFSNNINIRVKEVK